MMAANSDGCSLTAVVTCEGDLSDPRFPGQFESVLGTLQNLIGDQLKVHKLEPWNSVRVTLSIPREAALRLRQLASDGSQQLRALGILSVQVEGDQVISLRLAGPVPSETQEIVLQTAQDANPGPSSASAEANLAQLLQGNSQLPPEPPAPSEKVQFRSPNVVCPADSIVPKVPQTNAVVMSPAPSSAKPYAGPFPFTSMNQAMHSRDNLGTSTNQYPPNPPPPYPGNKHQPVNMTSPLLVNLLQNEGQSPKATPTVEAEIVNGVGGPPPYVQTKPPPPFVQKAVQLPPQKLKPQHQPAVFQKINTPQNVNIPSKAAKPVDVVGNNMFRHNSVKAALPLLNPPQLTQTPLPVTQPKPDTVSALQQQQKPVAKPPLTNNNTNNRAVPYHSYPSFNNSWDQPQMPQVQELTPTLPDLKADLDLDHLLPPLEQDLVVSPPLIPDEVTNPRPSRPKFLINPLTGELEPQSSSESEEETPSDVFTDLPSPATMSDEDTNSTHRPDTTDQSDSESRSGHSDSGKYRKKSREKGRDSPNLKQEKIRLRLKLEKSEPVSPAYKVDVSFINTQPKKAVPAEEPRVPPLHISLRGRNHAVINNKKRIKLNPDGTPAKPKARKMQDHLKLKKDDESEMNASSEKSDVEGRKAKRPREKLEPDFTKRDLTVFNFKEKLKERRGSDSELARSSKKHVDNNGILNDKKRRLSQTEESQTLVLGSTNTGTVSSISTHKPRKDKIKIKDGLKAKEFNRYKSYSKTLIEKLTAKRLSLPIAGDIDMGAKFKQHLMEEVDNIPVRKSSSASSPTITENNVVIQNQVTDLIHTLTEPSEVKDKPPEADKCNTPDRKVDITEKQPSRSPNSGGQGEDSGIESMDALSEKSPNQASQSPHADIQDNPKQKTQVPDMLDIEAQLAKMEGFTGDDISEANHNNEMKEDCCVNKEPEDNSKSEPAKKEEDSDPLPVRVTPPLYTYSNPEKSRAESPTSDTDSNHCPMVKSKSLLEQLLIDIPENMQPSSPSPAARSVRTRASSKMNSPELSSPVLTKQNKAPPTTKRKRQESDSSCNSLEDTRNKKQRKCSENASELMKACVIAVDTSKTTTTTKKKQGDESSDSDEPLIEYAGKAAAARKNNSQVPVNANSATTNLGGGVQRKLKPLQNSATGAIGSNTVTNNKTMPVNTRRSVRAQPALNTRSKGDKSQPDVDMLRRKTRSAVSEGEGKRRKDVK